MLLATSPAKRQYVWGSVVPDGSPGKVNEILLQVPFGHTVKTDKGSLLITKPQMKAVTMIVHLNGRRSKSNNQQQKLVVHRIRVICPLLLGI